MRFICKGCGKKYSRSPNSIKDHNNFYCGNCSPHKKKQVEHPNWKMYRKINNFSKLVLDEQRN